MKSTVLVTGAYGFVGRHLCKYLSAHGYQVIGWGNGQWEKEDWHTWGISNWYGSIPLPTATAIFNDSLQYVFHCAGGASVAASLNDPAQDFSRTVLTTAQLLDTIRAKAPQASVVLPSSAGVYGQVQALPISIDHPLCPVSPYGTYKKMSEELFQLYARCFDIKCSIVRLFSVYGLGLKKQLLWDACSKLLTPTPVFGGTGQETRDWIHVDDAVSLLHKASEFASSTCPIANGGTGHGLSISAVVNLLATAIGANMPPVFSGISRPGDPPHYVADISDALNFGWRPTRDYKKEMAAYAKWYLQTQLSENNS